MTMWLECCEKLHSHAAFIKSEQEGGLVPLGCNSISPLHLHHSAFHFGHLKMAHTLTIKAVSFQDIAMGGIMQTTSKTMWQSLSF